MTRDKAAFATQLDDINFSSSSASLMTEVKLSTPVGVMTTLSSILLPPSQLHESRTVSHMTILTHLTPPTSQYFSNTSTSMYFAVVGSFSAGSMMNLQK